MDLDEGGVRIELTLNYPRTASFKRLCYEDQCKVYDKWLDDALSFKFDQITRFERCYERCRDGTAHVHCDIWYTPVGVYNSYGTVCTFVKALLQLLPKRYNKFRDTNYDTYFCSYCSPAICLRLKKQSDLRRAQEWEVYIHKSS